MLPINVMRAIFSRSVKSPTDSARNQTQILDWRRSRTTTEAETDRGGCAHVIPTLQLWGGEQTSSDPGHLSARCSFLFSSHKTHTHTDTHTRLPAAPLICWLARAIDRLRWLIMVAERFQSLFQPSNDESRAHDFPSAAETLLSRACPAVSASVFVKKKCTLQKTLMWLQQEVATKHSLISKISGSLTSLSLWYFYQFFLFVGIAHWQETRNICILSHSNTSKFLFC